MLAKIKEFLPLALKLLFLAGLFVGLVALLLQVTAPLLASALAAGLAAAAGLVLLQVRSPLPAAGKTRPTEGPPGAEPGPALPHPEDVETLDNEAPLYKKPGAEEPDSALFGELQEARAQVRQLTRDLERSRAQIWHLNARHRDTSDKLEQVQSSLKTFGEKDLMDLEALLRLGYHDAVDDFKRRLLARAICETGGNRAEAARRLGLQRTYLYRLIKQLDIKP